MSQTIEAPKRLSVPESEDLARLRRLLIRARGFALALVECNVPVERDHFVERLRVSVAADGVDLVELRLTEAIEDLYDELSGMSLSAGQAVAVIGLEHSIPARSYFPPVLDRMNLKRELFRDLPGPVVIFLPEYALTQLAREAPDFWSWRTAVFDIRETQETEPIAQRDPLELDFFGYANLSADRKRDHLQVLQSLLADLEQRGGTEAERSDLKIRISYILLMLGDLDSSHSAAKEAVELARSVADDNLRLRALDRVADVFELRGDLDEALRIRQEELLPAYEKLENGRSRAITLGQIADIYETLGDLDEALRIRQEEELPVYEMLGDLREQTVALGKIADIYETWGDLDKALRIRQEEELPVYEKLGDMHSRAGALGKIARIYWARGDLDKALRFLEEESLPIFEQLGAVRERAVALGMIAGIYKSRGDLDEALRIRQKEELPVYEMLGDVRSRAITLGKIADIYHSQGHLDEALRIRREEELPVFENLKDVREQAITLGKIADVYLLQGDLDEAIRINQEESLPLLERLGDRRSLLVRWTNLATTLVRRDRTGDREQAAKLLSNALDFAEQMRIPEAEQIRGILEAHDLQCDGSG